MSYGQISYCSIFYNLAKGGFNPECILELGCGCSSFILRWLWTKANLTIIDDHPQWLKCTADMGGYKVDKRLLMIDKQGWIDFLKEGLYDLIFVDCGHCYDASDNWRPEFIKTIRENKILSPNGLIILHDATREQYREELTNWQVEMYEEEKTAVLRWK